MTGKPSEYIKRRGEIMNKELTKCTRSEKVTDLLHKLGIYESIVNGEFRCIFCNEIITIENVDSILPFESTYSFTCNRSECHRKLTQER